LLNFYPSLLLGTITVLMLQKMQYSKTSLIVSNAYLHLISVFGILNEAAWSR